MRNLLRLKEASDELAHRSRAKSAFLANMSHEIRTPMNAILGYAQILERDASMAPKHRNAVETILSSGEHLLGLINDVLELAKIEAGHRTIAKTAVDLPVLLDGVARMFELRAASKRLSFTVTHAPTAPHYVVTDEGKLRQILLNLVGNAVKFTTQGGVRVTTLTRTDADGAARLVVEVEDTGPGLEHHELRELFQPFSQTRVGIEALGGTGLGLALSFELAGALGGTIGVQSRSGEGSRFSLDLPYEEGKPPAGLVQRHARHVVALRSSSRRPKILIADDDPSQGWVAELLAAVGFRVRQVTNGADAVGAFAEWGPDLILMDVNMPVLGGYAATRAIRAMQAAHRVVIVAVTASGFDADRVAAHEAGADAWLSKPIAEDLLFAEIGGRLAVDYQRREVHPNQAPLAPEALAALVAEALPAELVAELRSACLAADYGLAHEILRDVPDEHVAVADALRALLDRFDYDALIAALVLGSAAPRAR